MKPLFIQSLPYCWYRKGGVPRMWMVPWTQSQSFFLCSPGTWGPDSPEATTLDQLLSLSPAFWGFTGEPPKRLGKPGILIKGECALGPALGGIARLSGLPKDTIVGTHQWYEHHSSACRVQTTLRYQRDIFCFLCLHTILGAKWQGEPNLDGGLIRQISGA